MENKLTQIFDVEVEDVAQKQQKTTALTTKPPVRTDIIEAKLDADLLSDLQASRQDFDTIIDLGKTALETVLSIAEQGQHPRFYEAAAMLLKSINEANKERMDVFVKLAQIRKLQAEVGKGPDITVEKGIFVGTTQQLQALMNPRKNEPGT
jgi:CHASE3 domain sensor protein